MSEVVRTTERLLSIAGFLLVVLLLLQRLALNWFGPDLDTIQREPLLSVTVPGAVIVQHRAAEATIFSLAGLEGAHDYARYVFRGQVDDIVRTFDDAARQAGWIAYDLGIPSRASWCRGQLFLEVRVTIAGDKTVSGYSRDLIGDPYAHDITGTPYSRCPLGAPPRPTTLLIGAGVALPFLLYLTLAAVARATSRSRRGGSVRRWGGVADHVMTFAWVPYVIVLLRPPPELAFPDSVRWAGIALAVTGVLFALWALGTIRRHFDLELEVHRDHEVVRRGPYALVRHPIYLGLAVHSIGACLATGSEILIAGTVLVTLPILYLRARAEERLLRDELGDAYDRYAREVPMLVPGVRR